MPTPWGQKLKRNKAKRDGDSGNRIWSAQERSGRPSSRPDSLSANVADSPVHIMPRRSSVMHVARRSGGIQPEQVGRHAVS